MEKEKLSKGARISTFTPQQTFQSVGEALSYWEASEDVLMGLFNWLIKYEHIALRAYQRSPRSVRTQLLKDALDYHSGRITDDEKATILDNLKKLEKLAKIRNQIAHGSVVDFSSNMDNEVVLRGVFLMPALNELGLRVSREPRYALTSGQIDEFREVVRDYRWEIFQAQFAATSREQNSS